MRDIGVPVVEKSVRFRARRESWAEGLGAEAWCRGAQLRGEFVATRAEYRKGAIAEIGEATNAALHTVNGDVHEARKKEWELTKAHWMAVRDRKVQKVRDQSEAEVGRHLVGLEEKVRADVPASSLGVSTNVRGQASHNGLEDLLVMDCLFYDSITRLGDPLATGICDVCPSIVSGRTGVTNGSIGIVGAPEGPVPAAANDARVVVVEKAASGAVQRGVEVGVPVGALASDLVVDSDAAEDATGSALPSAIESKTVGKVGPVAPSEVTSDAAEDVAFGGVTPVLDDTDTGEVVGMENGTWAVAHNEATSVAVEQVATGGAAPVDVPSGTVERVLPTRPSSEATSAAVDKVATGCAGPLCVLSGTVSRVASAEQFGGIGVVQCTAKTNHRETSVGRVEADGARAWGLVRGAPNLSARRQI